MSHTGVDAWANTKAEPNVLVVNVMRSSSALAGQLRILGQTAVAERARRTEHSDTERRIERMELEVSNYGYSYPKLGII